ncbi:peptidase inhibitor family I36 protein [Knoellia sp. p5-6-4]|uniref:peptidase inhibitor family I36 protein n=1 Tax=unclassified Knoellia TaxID=2618719 RepID=UPI0023DC98A3|nr:peptidase inhibitor family I36 protein [Knoellia sp. p5-6-4]MDF2144991.1 peptidase inhibitor family I36 protein [Knoellia sp. p5-6-4]
MRNVLAATTLAAALTAATAVPATAATGYDRCPQLKMCVFTGPNGSGTMAYFSLGDANLGDSNGPTGMNNNIESFFNNSGHHWDFFDWAGYDAGGGIRHSDPYVGGKNFGDAWDNRVSSLRDW